MKRNQSYNDFQLPPYTQGIPGRSFFTLNNLEWFNRVYTNLEDELYEACDLIEAMIENELFAVSSSEGEKHPSIHVKYSIPGLDYEGEQITIYFDPYNQEFYFNKADEELEVRVMLKTLDDIVEYIHHSVHESYIEASTEEKTEDQFPSFQFAGGNQEPSNLNGGLYPNDIKWLTEEIVTTEGAFGEPIKNIISYRIGKIEQINQFVLVRFDTTFVNGQKASKQGAIFPFNKGDEFVIQNLLNAPLHNG